MVLDLVELTLDLFLSLVVLIVSANADTFYFEGNISQYNPGVMQVVLQNRHIPEEVRAEQDFFIAVMSCEHLGRQATLTIENKTYYGLVTDCANYVRFPETVFWMLNNNIIGEVDFEFADSLGYAYRGFWGELEIHR